MKVLDVRHVPDHGWGVFEAKTGRRVSPHGSDVWWENKDLALKAKARLLGSQVRP